MIERLKVGYRTYRVERMDDREGADENRWGDINHRLGRIRVVDGLPKDREAFTLLHEVLHALFHDIGFDWPEDDEERMVERLTPRLAAFLRDNPKEVEAFVRMIGAEVEAA